MSLWLALLLSQTSADTCATCHPTPAREWAASMHRQAATSPVFLDGYRTEPHERCIACHAPTRPLRHEGITCVTCHEQGGVIQASSPGAYPYAHPLKFNAQLKSSEFCASCHEFQGHALVDGTLRLNSFETQTTVSEWKAWGGQKTCQQCHMPDGAHTFRGGHDEDYVRSALTLKVERNVAILTAHDVGHEVPTGDVFRHLVLWADDVPLMRFGLTLAPGVDEAGRPGMKVVRNTRLKPDETVRVSIPVQTREVRLTYHYTSPSPRERPGLTREDELFQVYRLKLR